MPTFKSVCDLFNRHDGTLGHPDFQEKSPDLYSTENLCDDLEKQMAANPGYAARPLGRLKWTRGHV